MPIVSGDTAKEIEKLLKMERTQEIEEGIKILENMFENSDENPAASVMQRKATDGGNK